MDVSSGLVDNRAIADDLYAKKDYEGAAEHYRKVLERQQTSASALKGLGLCLLMTGKVEEGIEACMTAANLQPSDAETRYTYGYALGMGKYFEDAIRELDATIYIQHDHKPAKSALMFCLITLGGQKAQTEPQKAAELFERAYKLEPRNGTAAASLLNFYGMSGQFDKAVQIVKELDEATRMDKNVLHVLIQLQKEPKFEIAQRMAGGR